MAAIMLSLASTPHARPRSASAANERASDLGCIPSSVNVAELAPLVGDAVDVYLKAYVDAASRLGAEWIVVHAGYHFGSDLPRRMEAGLNRLLRLSIYAKAKGTRILLENLNKEPPDAEGRYLAHTIEEWRWYYEKIQSPIFGLSFTANHAHL